MVEASLLLFAVVQLCELAAALGLEDTARVRMLRFRLLCFALGVCFTGASLSLVGA
jgi:hypothetical protein